MWQAGNSGSWAKETKSELVQVSKKKKKPGTESPESGGGGAGPQSQRDREQNPRVRGSKGPPTPDQEEGAGTPGVGKKTGLDPQVREKKATLLGLLIPERKGLGPPPGWGLAGRGAEGSGRAVLRHPRYICPRGRLISRPQITVSSQATKTPSPPA